MTPTVISPALIRDRLGGMRARLDEVAAAYGVNDLDLRLRLGLHLPKVWQQEDWNDDEAIVAEARRLAAQDRLAQAPYAHLAGPFPEREAGLYEFREQRGPDLEAKVRPTCSAFHYLRSFREDGRHFALVDAHGRTPAYLTLSPCDLDNVLSAWAAQGLAVRPEQLRVVSRIYVFRGGPRNAISRMLSCVRQWCAAEQPEVDGLVTYLNPNLGLSGVSYAASGYRLLAREAQWGAAYLDGDYATFRQIERVTGRTEPRDQSEYLGGRLSVACLPLMPLHLFGAGWRRLRRLNQIESAEARPWAGTESWA